MNVKTIRSIYYLALGLLVLSVFPYTGNALSILYLFPITGEIMFIHVLAAGVGIGAAYQFYYKAF